MLKTGLTVFDTIYTPETTLLIREAQEARLPRADRSRHVRPPAARSIYLFGAMPLALMTQVQRRALSPVNYNKLEQEKEKPKEPPSDEAGDAS